MKIFTAKQIREIDAYTIKNEPIPSIDLMERAAKALADWIKKRFNKNTQFLFICGPGNNGGDGWALARILFHFGYENIRFYLLNITDKLSSDSEINKQKLKEETDIRVKTISSEKDFPYISKDDWVIDALFGSGLSRKLEGLSASLVRYINKSEKPGVISIDIPSGLFSENNLENNPENIINARFTLSFQFPKLSFMLAESEDFTGNWHILDIGLNQEKIESEPTKYYILNRSEIKSIVKPRRKFSHKGTFGHSLIIAGSYGMMGAAVLACKAAINSGSGLVSAHIPRLGYDIIQCSVPETLVSFDESDIIFTEVLHLEKYNAIAVGPGLNKKSNTAKALHNLLKKIKVPLVLDADALNIISENKTWLDIIPDNAILTPHPKEFDRLTQDHKTGYERLLTQIEFSKKYNVIVVLKGAYTSISDTTGNVYFNSTGNPGMATGGTGDVLTGIIVSLLAQGLEPIDATKMAVFVHGLAGDLVLKKAACQGVTPTQIINKLGKAFKKTEN